MIKLLMTRILAMWKSSVFPTVPFIDNLVKSMIILRNYNIGPNHTVAIWYHNSPHWVSVYIASILMGCKVLIIPYNVDSKYITFVNELLLKNSVNFLWTSDKSTSGSIVKLLLRAIYNPLNTHIYSAPLSRQAKIQCDNMMADNIKVTKSLFKKLVTKDESQGALLSVTAGVNYLNEKIVYTPLSTIEHLIMKVASLTPFKKIPYINDKLVFETQSIYVKAKFSNSHIFSILMPFIYGNIFVAHQDNADIIVEDSVTFKKVWDDIFDLLLTSNINTFLYTKTIFKRLLVWALDRKFSRYYGKDKTIVIYNAELNTIMNYYIRRSKLNFITTYGTQELNQFVAINDYSNEILKESSCVGKLIPGLYPKIDNDNGELLINGDTLFSHYVWDDDYTIYSKNKGWFRTNDYGYYDIDDNSTYLMIEGKIKSMLTLDNGTVNLQEVENLLLSHPLISEVLARVDRLTHIIDLSIYPNHKMCGIKNVSIYEMQYIVDKLCNKIKQILPSHYSKLVASITSKPFDKANNGLIKRSNYNRVEV